LGITCAIIGGGIVGSAIAYELSRRGLNDIHVLDPDLEGTWSSTERNAGGVRHLWSHPVNSELSRISIRLFDQIADEIGFQRTGYLWLFSEKQRASGERLYNLTRARGLSYAQVTVPDLKKRWPFLDKTDDLAFGLFGSKDGLINPNALKLFFRREAKAGGVKFHDRKWVTRLTAEPARLEFVSLASETEAEVCLTSGKAPELSTDKQIWDADLIILAAGAWTRELLRGLVKDPKVNPIRRQIALLSAENFDLNAYGMIVDTSGVYFHAEGGKILAGFVLKDEPEGLNFSLDPDFMESHIWPALYERSSKFEKLKSVGGWGGLYSYTPDTSGILGKLSGTRGIYEAHSFTGRGLMQSYGAAVALAELIIDGKYQSIDASPLRRERFDSGDANALLTEQLHI
jgi:FAD-dependent oxidoreductase domain-containing protein 1